MAKLTDRQKSNIRAKYKTGQYTKVDLAKSYKVSEKTIRNITDGVEHENAHIVEASLLVEREKKSDKSPTEINAIEQAVKYRLEQEFNDDNNRVKIYDTTSKILDGVASLINKGKAQKVVTEGMGDGMSRGTVIEYDLQAEHYEKAINAVDKASITLGVNKRHAPKAEINNNNTNGQINGANVPEIEGYGVELITPDDVEKAKAIEAEIDE